MAAPTRAIALDARPATVDHQSRASRSPGRPRETLLQAVTMTNLHFPGRGGALTGRRRPPAIAGGTA